jgi:hypothetical protein
MPPNLDFTASDLVRYPFPCPVKWACIVYDVTQQAENAQGFERRYLETSRAAVAPGEVILLCHGTPWKISVLVYLSDHVWFPVPGAVTAWRGSWARNIRQSVQNWLNMTPAQRIVSGCAYAVQEMGQRLQMPLDRDDRLQILDAIQHYQELGEAASAAEREITADDMGRMLAAWEHDMAIMYGHDVGEIRNMLITEIAGPQVTRLQRRLHAVQQSARQERRNATRRERRRRRRSQVRAPVVIPPTLERNNPNIRLRDLEEDDEHETDTE